MEFTLRPLRLEDASAFFAEYASNAEASLFLPFEPAKAVSETEAYVKGALEQMERGDGMVLSIVDDDDRAFGNIEFRLTNNRCEIGFVVAPKHRNKGVMKAALRASLAFVRAQLPHVHYFAYVDSENAPSQRVLAATGFIRNPEHDITVTREKLSPPTRTMYYVEYPSTSPG